MAGFSSKPVGLPWVLVWPRPCMATIVIADLEESFLYQCSLKPLLWMRYIDDILTVWPHSKDDLQRFVKKLNTLTPRIRFICDSSDNSTTFLDLRIYKPPDFVIRGKLLTSIHFKPTNTFPYATGASHIAPHTFKGIAVGETIRALRNSESRTKYEYVQHQLLYHFRRCGYPVDTLTAIKGLDFSKRAYYLRRSTGKRQTSH